MNTRRGLALVAGAFAVCSASATEIIGTGGMVVTNGDYVVHTFTNNDTFVFSGGEVEVLLVGGGGGGGSGLSGGGGGGAGGFVHRERLSLWKASFPIRVGVGGAGCPSYATCQSGSPIPPECGGDTEAFGLIAHGGGAGGNTGHAGYNGASGGGGATRYNYADYSSESVAGGQALEGEGSRGGAATNSAAYKQGHIHNWHGGGGGAGAVGEDGICLTEEGTGASTTGRAGKGGDGLPCAITGENLYYAGGGGGGYADYSNPSEAGTVSGGKGGGGAGSGGPTGSDPWSGVKGVDGLGGGGGGGGAVRSRHLGAGGAGGCGTVIVRYRRELPDEGSVVAKGAEVSYNDDATSVIYTFKGNGTFSVSGGALVDVLLVGGGGGGGSGLAGGGGGGAGGFIYRQSQYVADGTYEIVVGNGGAGGQPTIADDDEVAATDAENGENTQAFGLVAHGGGAGGRSVKLVAQTRTMSGKDGGSGGGAATLYHSGTVATYSGGAACEGEGFAGGRSTNVLTSAGNQGHVHCWAGGGGGAGEAGADGICTLEAGTGAETTGQAGKGGDGLPCSITGKELYYAGGGGGGFADWSNPSEAGTVSGGLGGGGAGSGGRTVGSAWAGCDGTDGLGGGGGGGGAFYIVNKAKAAGGKGGKGVVIVRCRYRVRPFEKVVTQGAKRSRAGDYRVFTFTNNGTISVTGDGVVDVLLVGGGGGGGSGLTGGGGGGAGGFLYKTRIMVTNGTYQIVVGDGGAGGADYQTNAENGGDTRAFGFLVHGGGAGGRGINTAGGPGADGASGGGGASQYQMGTITSIPGGEGLVGEGFCGGRSTNEVVEISGKPARGFYHVYAGGGGGAGAKGADAWIVKSGAAEEDIVGAAGRGGDGLPCSITGTELYYAGGGGGGYADKTNPSGAGTVEGGRGGGGKGSGGLTKTGAAPWNGLPGEDGFGGGGGGAGAYGDKNGGVGGKGGAGAVIIRCQVVPSDKGLILLFR